ncbi:JmjC domain-containing protein [Pseudomonas aeruginosa]|uniref:JmjC domain-containing protein n=1 Tax=Pseudomonas aeruginosa TaxID=287 RepID=UPI002380FA18|nr:cupin domain-containing protein [Pseudomonas aeruginosa]MDE4568688.1 cupin domain-containing protein [Pseudomonas aeruginosa]
MFRLEEVMPGFEYSLADFEVDLWINRFRTDHNIRMAGEDKEIYPTVAAARQDALQWVFEGLANGFTAIFNKLNLCNPKVSELCYEIGRAYPNEARTFVTAFLSPSSQYCFGYHYDEVDVFLIQVHGTKSWSIAEPDTAFPIEGMNKLPVAQDQSGREYLRVDLVPGDVLYIPRGHIHRGLPGSAGSLHLSAGVHVPTVADGIVAKIRSASMLEESLRRPLSAGQAYDAVREVLRGLEPQFGPNTTHTKPRVYLPHNSLVSTLRIGNLEPDDLLVRTGGEPINYRLSSDLSTIEVFGLLFDLGVRSELSSKAAVPAGYFRALQMINESTEFSPRILVKSLDITITDSLELVRKLLTIGLLEFQ